MVIMSFRKWEDVLEESFIQKYIAGGDLPEEEELVLDEVELPPEVLKWIKIRKKIVQYFSSRGGPGTFMETERYDFFHFVRYHLNRAINPFGGWPGRIFHRMSFDQGLVGLAFHVPIGHVIDTRETYRAWTGRIPGPHYTGPMYRSPKGLKKPVKQSFPTYWYDTSKFIDKSTFFDSNYVNPYNKRRWFMKAVIIRPTRMAIGSDEWESTWRYLKRIIPFIGSSGVPVFGSEGSSISPGEDFYGGGGQSPVPIMGKGSLGILMFPLVMITMIVDLAYIADLYGRAKILPVFPYVAFYTTYPYEIIKHNWLAIRHIIDLYFKLPVRKDGTLRIKQWREFKDDPQEYISQWGDDSEEEGPDDPTGGASGGRHYE